MPSIHVFTTQVYPGKQVTNDCLLFTGVIMQMTGQGSEEHPYVPAYVIQPTLNVGNLTSTSDLDKDEMIKIVMQGSFKKYQCTLCGMESAKKCYIKKHTAIHTGEKPYKCLGCGKAFGRMSGMIRHKRQCWKMK